MKSNLKIKPAVGVVMGSDSDWPLLEPALKTLRDFGVPCEVEVMSAHRTPRRAAQYSTGAAGRGIKVIIAAAGGAAHLAGVIAAHTSLPVIGIPIKGGALDGLDSLLSTIQMPAGIPVATVALGSAGPVNAALLAVQILALANPALAAKLRLHKQSLKQKVIQGNRKVQEQWRSNHG
jgi:phosphoribosylaminoimidazole carboxylase PurE protein